MKIVYVALVILLFSSAGFSQGTVKVKEASIAGEKITLGQGADIVQGRLKADKFVSSGYNYGDASKGYYSDKGASYVVTFGPPKGGDGGYVVTQIEKVERQEQKDPKEPAKKTVKKEVVTEFPIVDYTAISFDTSESALTTRFPSVKCEQMPNPNVRMCRLAATKSESISYLYHSGKLININGRTRTEIPQPPQVTCEVARTRFLACQQRSGDAFVDCLANINTPPGCR